MKVLVTVRSMEAAVEEVEEVEEVEVLVTKVAARQAFWLPSH
jgi:hypothetical protein